MVRQPVSARRPLAYSARMSSRSIPAEVIVNPLVQVPTFAVRLPRDHA